MTWPRTEGVGSLLRPPRAARRARAPRRRRARSRRLQADRGRAVLEAIRLQEEVGIGVVSDGELRRRGWMSHFFESVEGFESGAGPSLPWRGVDGELPPELRGGMRPVVVEPLRWRHSACAEEWTFLRGHTDRPAKVTLISAEMAAAMYEPERSAGAYPTREAYFADVEARSPAAAVVSSPQPAHRSNAHATASLTMARVTGRSRKQCPGWRTHRIRRGRSEWSCRGIPDPDRRQWCTR